MRGSVSRDGVGPGAVLAAVLAVLSAAGLTGCVGERRADPAAPAPAGERQAARPAPVHETLQADLMSFADGFATQVSDALERIQSGAESGELRAWALRMRLTTTLTATTIAGGSNPIVSTLDMVVFVTLRRIVLEDYWIPSLLGDLGMPLLDAYSSQEREIWSLASRILDDEQQEELRELIAEWRLENPDQRLVAHVRFSDFGAYQTRFRAERRGPGSFLQLLNLDPLAGADPLVAELKALRLLTERIFFFVERTPIIATLLSEQLLADAATSPDGRRIIDSFERASDAASRLTETTETIPALIERERRAAIEQIGEEAAVLRADIAADLDALIDRQRERTLAALAGEDQRLRGAMADLRDTLSAAHAAIDALDGATRSITALVGQFQTDDGPEPARPSDPLGDLRAAAESIERSVTELARLAGVLRQDEEGTAAAVEAVSLAAQAAGDAIAGRFLRVGLVLIGAVGVVMIGAPLLRQAVARRCWPA